MATLRPARLVRRVLQAKLLAIPRTLLPVRDSHEYRHNPIPRSRPPRHANVAIGYGARPSSRKPLSQYGHFPSTPRLLDSDKLAKDMRDHAWFIGYAPMENPTIAFAVLVEHGGHGGTISAPIVRKVLETYFGIPPREEPPPRPEPAAAERIQVVRAQVR